MEVEDGLGIGEVALSEVGVETGSGGSKIGDSWAYRAPGSHENHYFLG